MRPDTEERGMPQHQVRQLAGLNRANLAVKPVGDRRADRIFRDIAARPGVVRAPGAAAVRGDRSVAGQGSAAFLHHVRGLPGAQHHLADPAHRLGVRADHGNGPHVMQDVLGRDRRRADPRLGEREVLGDGGVQVVADHEHVEVLVDGVDRVRTGRVGGGGQYVGHARPP